MVANTPAILLFSLFALLFAIACGQDLRLCANPNMGPPCLDIYDDGDYGQLALLIPDVNDMVTSVQILQHGARVQVYEHIAFDMSGRVRCFMGPATQQFDMRNFNINDAISSLRLFYFIPAGNCMATLYEGPQQTGISRTFAWGEYSTLGTSNDKYSSVSFGANTWIRLYDNTNFGGFWTNFDSRFGLSQELVNMNNVGASLGVMCIQSP